MPMNPSNILVVASSARELDQFITEVEKVGYIPNSDIIYLENGDFSQVVKKKSK
jgi:hypothetical protein